MGQNGKISSLDVVIFSHLTSDLRCFKLCNLKLAHLVTYSFHFLSIAMGCIYTEAKNYPREPAAHVAISEFFHSVLSFTFGIYYLYLLLLVFIMKWREYYARNILY